MSSPPSSKHGPYRKPRANIYTVLLIIALVAVLLGCLFAYLETADYPGKPPWSGASSWLVPVERTDASFALADPIGRIDSKDSVCFPLSG